MGLVNPQTSTLNPWTVGNGLYSRNPLFPPSPNAGFCMAQSAYFDTYLAIYGPLDLATRIHHVPYLISDWLGRPAGL